MKIFISWSKEPSKKVAEALRDWLPEVIQSLKPWISRDIPAGSRWNAEIANELATTKFGIICVTKSNQREPWLQFEAGALAKTLDVQTRVCPYLIDFDGSQLEQGPLVAFQSDKADKAGTKKLVKDINIATKEAGFEALKDVALDKAFDRVWGELENVLQNLGEPEDVQLSLEPSLEEMISEILLTSRESMRRLNTIRELAEPHPKFAYPSLTIYVTGEKDDLEEYSKQIVNIAQQVYSVFVEFKVDGEDNDATSKIRFTTHDGIHKLNGAIDAAVSLAESQDLLVLPF